jgi:uncharacterized membrane protein
MQSNRNPALQTGIGDRTFTEYLTDMTKNVGDPERIISAVAGVALTAYGISRGGILGILGSVAGGALALRGLTGHCQIYDALGIDTSEQQQFSGGSAKSSSDWWRGKVEVVKSITINQSPAELYSFWRNFENLPKFMNHLEKVNVIDETRSEWIAKAPLGTDVRWGAIITEDRENELIAWRSVENSEIPNSGKVEFLPTADRGAVVKVSITYEPPGGKIGSLMAKLFGEEPSWQVAEDLRRFKSLMETGLIISVEGQTSGRADMSKTAKA